MIAAFAQRARGFQFALGESGAAPARWRSAPGLASVDEGRQLMRDALREDGSLTAVFAHNDLLAMGAIAAARQAGLSCPGDVSVVGYGATPLTEYLDPALDDRAVPRPADGALRRRDRALGPARRRAAVGRGAAAPADRPGLHRPRAGPAAHPDMKGMSPRETRL